MKADKSILRYYAKGGKNHLYQDAFQLERVRNQGIILRYLPKKKNLKILDIGEGCGFYSF